MNDINQALFLLINVSEHPNTLLLWTAKLLAEYSIWLITLVLIGAWLRGKEHTRKLLLEATAAGMAGLLINQAIGVIWQHPRPFMLGLGNALIPHAADSSFPSIT